MTKPNPFAHLLVKKPAPNPAPAAPQAVESGPPAKSPPAPSPVAATLKTSTAANPFLSLTAAPADQPFNQEIDLTATHTDVAATVVEELGHLDTEKLEPHVKRESNINVKAAQRAEKLVLADGAEVQTLCDKIDKLIEANTNLAGPPLYELRKYVQVLMVTLKERPEFDSFVLDKDIRNVMKFIRSTREEALALREVKTTKKVVRQENKRQKGIKEAGMQAAFNAILGNGSFKLK